MANENGFIIDDITSVLGSMVSLLKFVKREGNRVAYHLAQYNLSSCFSATWVYVLPHCISDFLKTDLCSGEVIKSYFP